MKKSNEKRFKAALTSFARTHNAGTAAEQFEAEKELLAVVNDDDEAQMGNRFVVKVWEHDGQQYREREAYRGEDMAEALATFFREKAAGSGCVTLEWR